MKPFGLYIHIPFCSHICHYCDFSKTANFNDEHTVQYFRILESQFKHWMARSELTNVTFSSVFFGGGTPGLFSREYQSLIDTISPYLRNEAEITIECNPKNITSESLKTWKNLGFNRISIGVQSFQNEGLKALTRDHTESQSRAAVSLAAEFIENINIDLIYGWSGQTKNSWENDIKSALNLPIKHLSLYSLTFEGQTPFARSLRRGLMKELPDSFLADTYEYARNILKQNQFHHEEISNWAKENFASRHNHLYWQSDYYVGIGCGAHGFIPSDAGTDHLLIGKRYSYTKDLRQYLRESQTAGEIGVAIYEEDRTSESWLFEYIGCALRCAEGVDLQEIESRGWTLKLTSQMTEAINQGTVMFKNNIFSLIPSEWFRETSWSYLLSQCFIRGQIRNH
jgi:oxygen-independent coproporphyrinogen-3 oxidase